MPTTGVPTEGLYFPFIEIPAGHDLTAVLLYWDRLVTIAPRQVRMSPRMTQLIDCGLVETVDPSEYDQPPDEWVAEAVEETARASREAPWDRVHMRKGGWRLWSRLINAGVAETRGNWIMLPRPAAAFYMAYLASWLGRELRLIPVTDQPRWIEGFLEQAPALCKFQSGPPCEASCSRTYPPPRLVGWILARSPISKTSIGKSFGGFDAKSNGSCLSVLGSRTTASEWSSLTSYPMSC